MATEDTFIDAVKQWVKIDDTVREVSQKVRELKQEKKGLEDKILSFMRNNEQEVLQISSGGTLRLSLSKVKGGLKEDYIRDVLTRFTKDPDETSKIVEVLMSDRPQTERTYLKRCQPRGGVKKSS